MIIRKLRLLTLSKVDPLPVLNYAHNCTTPLLTIIDHHHHYHNDDDNDNDDKKLLICSTGFKRTTFKTPKKLVLVLATWVAKFRLVTVNILVAPNTHTCTPPPTQTWLSARTLDFCDAVFCISSDALREKETVFICVLGKN